MRLARGHAPRRREVRGVQCRRGDRGSVTCRRGRPSGGRDAPGAGAREPVAAAAGHAHPRPGPPSTSDDTRPAAAGPAGRTGAPGARAAAVLVPGHGTRSREVAHPSAAARRAGGPRCLLRRPVPPAARPAGPCRELRHGATSAAWRRGVAVPAGAGGGRAPGLRRLPLRADAAWVPRAGDLRPVPSGALRGPSGPCPRRGGGRGASGRGSRLRRQRAEAGRGRDVDGGAAPGSCALPTRAVRRSVGARPHRLVGPHRDARSRGPGGRARRQPAVGGHPWAPDLCHGSRHAGHACAAGTPWGARGAGRRSAR